MQYKYDLTYKVVYVENKYFHSEEYLTDVTLSSIDEKLLLYRLNIKGTVKFSILPKYRLTVLIPKEYTILNPPADYNLNLLPGYVAYNYTISSRAYRDLKEDIPLFIYASKSVVSEKVIKIVITRENDVVHSNDRFFLTTDSNRITLRS